jgi:prepilin-type N-terminal cleavage/methylation domain-containing protein
MKMTRHSRRGMTLIELLLVSIILGLIMSLGLSVGRKMLTGADRRKTIGTMAIVMGAIDVYYQQCGAYPPQQEDASGNAPVYGTNQYDYSDVLLEALKSCPASQKALSDLDQQAMNEGAYCGPAFIDGFNQPILYTATGGLGGRPRLLSAGPDGKYKSVTIKNAVGGSAQMGGKDDDITSESK